MKNKWKVLLALMLVSVMALTACGNKTENTAKEGEKPAETETTKEGAENKDGFWTRATNKDANPQAALDRKNTIVVGASEFNGTFNPVFASTVYDQDVASNVQAFALEADIDGKIIDGMCHLDIISATEYKLTLLGDYKFTDGKPVTADDIKFSFMLVAHKDFDGLANYDDYKIKGLEAYHKGEAEDIEGIVVSDDKKSVTFTLEEPNVHFKYAAGTPILPQHYYAPEFPKIDMEFVNSLNTKPLGAGPFTLEDYVPGQEVTLKANKDFYRGTPGAETLVFKAVPNASSLQAVLTGDIDIFPLDAIKDNRDQLEAAGFVDLCIYPTNGYGYVGFNQKASEQLKDPKVRHALAHATNRAEVVSAVYGDFGNVINIVQSKVSPFFTEEGINKYEYDMEKAAKLLEEAGYKKNASGILEKDGQPLKINFLGIEDHTVQKILLPEIIRDYKALGVDFTVEYVDWGTLVERVDADEAQMWFMAWNLGIDPDNANIFGTNKPQNNMGYSNEKLDDLYKEAYKAEDEAKQKEFWAEIYKTINKDLPSLPIYQRSDMVAVNSRVQGLQISPYQHYRSVLWQAKVAE